MIARLVASLFMAGIGISAGSQAPEFAQQYYQRLGGAVDELRTVVEDFDRDAQKNGLERDAALERMIRNSDNLVRDRGSTMSTTIRRHERITGQLRALESAPEIMRPVIALRAMDDEIAKRTLEVYRPAVPLTLPGLAYGFIGMIVLGFLTWLLMAVMRLLVKPIWARQSSAGVGRS
ncbi:MAG: DUF2937 family protein [Pseudomonadota bacterium]